jgi:hypothetical protein
MLPPYWKQERSPKLPDPAYNYHGLTGVIPKGGKETIYPKLNVGETGLISVIDTPTLTPAHDGLFYIARTSTSHYQIDTLASRQVVVSSVGSNVSIENKGTTNESYKWGIIHLI